MDELWLLVTQTVVISVPLVLAALGGTCSERGGVVNIALEGILLVGAFAAAVVAHRSGSAWLGLAAAVAAGTGVASLHAYLSVSMRADQIISGLAINLFAMGATEYGAHVAWPAAVSRTIPNLGPATLWHPLVVGTIVLAALLWLVLTRTPFGLRLQAVGENPGACATVGLSVGGLRYAGVGLSGVLAGIGGAWLAFNVSQFQHGMSAGKGYIAMAAVVFGKWHPLGATAACLLFAFSEALGAAMERWRVPVPSQLLTTLPYVLTIVALVGFVGRARSPAALGTPYEKASA
jgi:simple sugar transport system permease protein